MASDSTAEHHIAALDGLRGLAAHSVAVALLEPGGGGAVLSHLAGRGEAREFNRPIQPMHLRDCLAPSRSQHSRSRGAIQPLGQSPLPANTLSGRYPLWRSPARHRRLSHAQHRKVANSSEDHLPYVSLPVSLDCSSPPATPVRLHSRRP